MSNVARSILGLFSILKSYTPTYGASSGTFPSVNVVRYVQIGKWLFLLVNSTGTVTGTPASVTLTLPAGLIANGLQGGSCYVSNAVAEAGIWFTSGGGTAISVNKVSGAFSAVASTVINLFIIRVN